MGDDAVHVQTNVKQRKMKYVRCGEGESNGERELEEKAEGR